MYVQESPLNVAFNDIVLVPIKKAKNFSIKFLGHILMYCISVCSFPACPPGSYKMSSRQQECFPCPANSVAEEEGSVVCVCEEDHFRTPLDTPSAPCTSNKIRFVQ